ncbi:hypothetical protein BH23ACT9_BH23ACT9_19680 [soil metagenome]
MTSALVALEDGSTDHLLPGQALHGCEGVERKLERLVFEDLGDGRTRLTSTSHAESLEGRDAMIAMGMEQGVLESYARLDEVLARRAV